ncbi:Transducin/WD40 repeat-like superfamily protein [Cinnamomum micranthum f. kanehirae]|uniref:Transducin/WD40 repeat-like superfamily protein n=1 Tax=Cinnamomum micranthum f. kanehirae TaxID=337451 RepID=A0A3S3P2W8_9MAGN|nr:Transducin/WD40 repeat-like superfamily protein [Cinnamomum micranthum f. kanehirae]
MRGRKGKTKVGGSFCVPGLSSKRASPVSLLERFRKLVFRLIMLSAISKTQQTETCSANGSRPYPRGDSHYSEAVADCIEFIKKTASEEGETA